MKGDSITICPIWPRISRRFYSNSCRNPGCWSNCGGIPQPPTVPLQVHDDLHDGITGDAGCLVPSQEMGSPARYKMSMVQLDEWSAGFTSPLAILLWLHGYIIYLDYSSWWTVVISWLMASTGSPPRTVGNYSLSALPQEKTIGWQNQLCFLCACSDVWVCFFSQGPQTPPRKGLLQQEPETTQQRLFRYIHN